MSQEIWGFALLLLNGFWVTVLLLVAGCALALVVAFVAAFAKMSPFFLLRTLAVIYIEFFRGTSLFVQLFWAFFVLPLFGIFLSPIMVAIAILGMNFGAYGAEVVRAGIDAVPREQREASVANNLTRPQMYRHVIIPQALLFMLPTLNNNAIEMLKATAVVSLITITDLTFQAQIIRSVTGNSLYPFLAILVLYYLTSTTVTFGFRRVERKLSFRN